MKRLLLAPLAVFIFALALALPNYSAEAGVETIKVSLDRPTQPMSCECGVCSAWYCDGRGEGLWCAGLVTYSCNWGFGQIPPPPPTCMSTGVINVLGESRADACQKAYDRCEEEWIDECPWGECG